MMRCEWKKRGWDVVAAALVVVAMGCGARPAQPTGPTEPEPPPVVEPPPPVPEVEPPVVEPEPPVEPPPVKEPDSAPVSVHLALGVPRDKTPDDDVLLDHEEMAIGYSPYLNAANWVSWRTVAKDFGGAPRASSFTMDKGLPGDMYHPRDRDYSNSGFERGHMVRSEERTSSVARNKATFVLSNILPQTPELNKGAWADLERELEERVRKSKPGKDAYVIAGPIWSAACATHKPRVANDGCRDIGSSRAPNERVAVPEAFFKIIVFVDAGAAVQNDNKREVVAVIMPNVAAPGNEWTVYEVKVAEIEKRTGYDFLSRIDRR